MKEFPTKVVAAPYIVQPDDLGHNLLVTSAGAITFGPLLNATFNRFSMMVVNGSAGAVTINTSAGALIRPAGRTPLIGSITITAGQSALMAAIPDSLEWMGLNLAVNTTVTPAPAPSPSPSPSPAPVGGVEAYVYWGGAGLNDTLNGGPANANPTLANGGTFPFVVHVSNPLGVPVTVQFTELYAGITAGSNFGPQTVPANGYIALNGTLTVSGTVGANGYIRLTLTDPYGATQRADIPFVIGAPVGAPAPAPSPGGTPAFTTFSLSQPAIEIGTNVTGTLLFSGPPNTSINANVTLNPPAGLSGPTGEQIGVNINFNSSGVGFVSYTWLATTVGMKVVQVSALAQTRTAQVNVMNLESGN